MRIVDTIKLERGRAACVNAANSIMSEAAQFMAARARQYAPIDTGFLKSSIIVTSENIVFPGNSGQTVSYTVMATAIYATWVEFGHVTKSGRHVPPNPYMRKALSDTQVAFSRIASGITLDNFATNDLHGPQNYPSDELFAYPSSTFGSGD